MLLGLTFFNARNTIVFTIWTTAFCYSAFSQFSASEISGWRFSDFHHFFVLKFFHFHKSDNGVPKLCKLQLSFRSVDLEEIQTFCDVMDKPKIFRVASYWFVFNSYQKL